MNDKKKDEESIEYSRRGKFDIYENAINKQSYQPTDDKLDSNNPPGGGSGVPDNNNDD